MRKFREINNVEHKALFFEPWENPVDGQVYYMYNRKYFEHNRPNKEWTESPDLFTENCAPEVKPYLDELIGAASKKKEKEKEKEKDK